ncbi:MAG TPA: hypothetical protein VNE00_17625 [Paraburkholderia sp.]|nr:hypothetical protein [Paraburkholderia sp.]
MNMPINRSRLESIPRELDTKLPEKSGRSLEGATPRTRELAPHMQTLRDMRGGARPPAQDTPTIGAPIERPPLRVGTVNTSASGKPSIGDPVERPQLHIGTVNPSASGRPSIGEPVERPQLHIGTVNTSASGRPSIGDPVERPQLHVGTVNPSASGRPSIGDPVERPQLHIGTVSTPMPLSNPLKLGPGLALPPMGASANSALSSAGAALKPLAQSAATAMAGGAATAALSAAGSAIAGPLGGTLASSMGGSLSSAIGDLTSRLPMPGASSSAASAETAASSIAAPSGTDPSQASGASGAASGGTDLENGMSNLQQQDPTLFAKIMKDGQSGDGNSLVEDELQAYKEGALTKDQATEAVSGAQSLANQNGGGKINNKVKGDAQAALGGSYINGGQTRFEHGVSKFFESFTPIGALVKGIGDATSSNKSGPEDVLTAAQPALQQGGQTAMADLAAVDPSLADKFQADAKAGDGNSMVEDLVKAKQEEQANGMPNTFTDQDAQLLGSQIGAAGKGKVNDTEDKAFTQAFGTDTLFRGSSSLSKAFNKAEDSVGGFMQQLVSPVTDTVGGVDKLVHGDVKGAFKDFGNAALGAVSDAAMVVAPEAAPEIEIGSMALRGGLDAGKAAASAATDGSSLLTKGIKFADKTNDYYNDANDVSNLVSGNGNGNNGNDDGSQQV